MSQESIEAECWDCDGTGLYIGCAEPKGTAVICATCGGSGCEKIWYKPFTRRKGRRGIQTIYIPRVSTRKETMTKKEAARELRRLLKPRTYLVRIWEECGIRVEAKWISALDVDVEISKKTWIGARKKKGVFTSDQLQIELAKFKQDIKELCDASDELAKQDGCKGEYERFLYFEGLKY
ncbi:hypothetical protein LCGC14_0142480 [marine sediment metagenome]|uniref:Uncharacterized protein n=1 Tax=marine sediment metagenome TaxID=412755 RepID=A0A0F9Y2V1_9ZZZZ